MSAFSGNITKTGEDLLSEMAVLSGSDNKSEERQSCLLPGLPANKSVLVTSVIHYLLRQFTFFNFRYGMET